MAKPRSRYVCEECGAEAPKWGGRCPSCGAWNTLVEELVRSEGRGLRVVPSQGRVEPLAGGPMGSAPRCRTGLDEFDRVLGGGLVRGEVVLVGGEPGIGKSTLMLQVACRLAGGDRQVLYVTGEESVEQTRLRADRLGVEGAGLSLLAETDVEVILGTVEGIGPEMVVIDSIQTAYWSALESAPGSVSQVRESAGHLARWAKTHHVSLFLIGHVTKEGGIAGPKTLEHMVDTVLYFEGEAHHAYRILRATKNRFGSTNEIGIFEMTEGGLSPVANPSELFRTDGKEPIAGTAVVSTLEGSRPLLVEIQALVTPSSYAVPQRVASGLDGRRLALLLAVLEKRLGLRFGHQDVFVNVVGGLRLTEPAVDLGVAAALASSLQETTIPRERVYMGEVGLGGEIRPVREASRRVREAASLGFREIYLSAAGHESVSSFPEINLVPVASLGEAIGTASRGARSRSSQ